MYSIGAILIAHGISQADLARSLGVNRAQVTRWVQGSRHPDALSIARIADRFGDRAALTVLKEILDA